MRAQSLERALPVIAGFIADRTGIEIVRGSRAATDNKVIFLPQRRCELDISEKDLVKTVAYLYHESGHMRHSNFNLSATTPIQRAITGPLEDIRIENLIMGEFPAARRYLSRLTEMLVQDTDGGASFPMLSGSETDAEIIQRYILYRLRHEALRQAPMKGVSENAIEVARNRLPATMLTRLDALMFQVTDCASEDEVFELSDAIISMIKEEQEKEEEKKRQEQQQQQQQQQPGQSDDDGTADDENHEADPDESGQPGSTSDETADSEAEDEATSSSTQSSGAGGGVVEENAAETLANILGMTESQVQEDIGEMLEAALNAAAVNEAQVGVSVSMPNNHKASLKSFDVDMARLRGNINAVRTKTLQWMSSVAEEDVVHSRSGMQIDSSRIWSSRLGGSIFVRTDEGIDLNAAVSIVIDRSGSMSSTIGQAAQAAVATMLAFDVPGLKTQVTVFPWYQDRDEGVSVIKRWEESPRQFAGRITHLTTDGGTPMAEAILFAASDIMRREESLKIIMVVTDGDPDDKTATRYVIERARESGITVVALGIGVDPSLVFTEKYAASINDVGALSSSMVRLVKTAFEDRKTLQ